jgi:hypothetical protein
LPSKPIRGYALLALTGREVAVPGRFDELDQSSVSQWLADLSAEARLVPGRERFESAYLKYRFRLATARKATFVATRLRRFLSMNEHDAASPRLSALRAWGERVWQEDIEASLGDGCPRKTIVFSTWVGGAGEGEVARIRAVLGEAFGAALNAVGRRHPGDWREWRQAGATWVRGLEHRLQLPEGVGYRRWVKQNSQLTVILNRLAADELVAVLAGASERFQSQLLAQFQRQLDLVGSTWREYDAANEKHSIEGRAAQRRLNDAIAGVAFWGGQQDLAHVERYTGDEDRLTRDRAAACFRGVTSPWILVASNVGAEGIDLHTYTRRIVHYDLEWNPARMEQREGRGDRVGRVLRDPLSIVYCLVPRTYDERMFHQLVARDRWHGVLLGKAAARLANDKGAQEARLEEAAAIRRMRLNLAPTRFYRPCASR